MNFYKLLHVLAMLKKFFFLLLYLAVSWIGVPREWKATTARAKPIAVKPIQSTPPKEEILLRHQRTT